MKYCLHCARESQEDALRCQFCGHSLFCFEKPRQRMPASRRLVLFAVCLGLLGALLLASKYSLCSWKLSRLERQLAEQRAQAQAEHEAALSEQDEAIRKRADDDEDAHRARLQDQSIMSGTLAAQRHRQEWSRRIAHDQLLAASPMEKNLLDKIGRAHV